MSALHIGMAVDVLWRGGLIAYPTEAVWGLGCDPLNEEACLNLLQIKQRPVGKGMILVAADMQQIDFLLQPLTEKQKLLLQKSWPGPETWLIPDDLDQIPVWIKGDHQSVAVRVSAHPIVQQLCTAFGGPLVSTSANKAGQRPARTRVQLARVLAAEVDYVVPGALGNSSMPSKITDLVTGQLIR